MWTLMRKIINPRSLTKIQSIFIFLILFIFIVFSSSISSPSSANQDPFVVNVYVRNDLAVLCCGQPGFEIVNISDLEQPKGISAIDTPGSATGAIIIEDIVYIADEHSDLQVFNIKISRLFKDNCRFYFHLFLPKTNNSKK